MIGWLMKNKAQKCAKDARKWRCKEMSDIDKSAAGICLLFSKCSARQARLTEFLGSLENRWKIENNPR